jgi:murein DD-endopeptidase MepM/ murein hydrolase activator NlpD
MPTRPGVLLALALAGVLPAARLSAAEPFVPELALPIACAVGQTCHIQNLVDLDPGPGVSDFTCGTMTYEGHDGVDFRLPDLAAMRAGVDVLAAAPGRVRAVRDGMPDRSVRETGRGAVASRECGNGVVIAHGDGWETQYCHLGEGSIRVARGQRVEAGTVLGRVGVSGLSEYPHLHFTVRRRGATVDAFAFERDPETCGSGRPLWAPALRASLAYRTPVVLNAGFSDGAVSAGELESGALAERRIGPDPPALVAYARGIVLKAGDVQRLTLLGPGGEPLSENAAPPLERPRAQHMLFTGKRRPAAGWAPGTYTGVYTVERDGAVVLRNEVRVEMPAS